MPPKDVEPPRHVETHAYIFDRTTGEVLATHTRWTEEGAPPPKTPISRELLKSVAVGSERAARDLDVVEAKARETRVRLRVDLATRKVVVSRSASKPLEVAPPERLIKP